jgi:tyrosyl-tRNA synthetase
MSKSDPDSAIFMEDTTEEVEKKIKQGYCPEGEIKENPIFDYCKYIIFDIQKSLKIEREEKHGGDIVYDSYESLVAAYESKQIHPNDLKPAVAKAINAMLDPIRAHFLNDAYAKELLAQIKEW